MDIPETPINSTTDLLRFWEAVKGPWGFDQYSIWLAPLDHDNRPMRMLLPVDDVPPEPEDDAQQLAVFLQDLFPGLGAHSVALMFSRPGPDLVRSADRQWARRLHGVAGALTPWPVFLATDQSVRQFAPDDLVA